MSNNGAEIDNTADKSSENQKSSDSFNSRAMDEVMTDYQSTKSKSDSPKTASGSDGFEIMGLGGEGGSREGNRNEGNAVPRPQGAPALEDSTRTGIANDATREDIPETNRLGDLRGFGGKTEEKEFGGKTQEKDFGGKTQEKDFSGKTQEKDSATRDREPRNPSNGDGASEKNQLPDLGGDMHRELQWTEVGRGGIQGARTLLSNDGFGNDDQRQHLTESMQRIADLLPNGGLSATIDEINRRLESQNSDMRVEIDLARVTGPNSIPVDILGHPSSISIVRRGDARSQYLFGNNNKRK